MCMAGCNSQVDTRFGWSDFNNQAGFIRSETSFWAGFDCSWNASFKQTC